MVTKRVKELEEEEINVKKLSEKEEEKLGNLRTIEVYLNRAIDEHQRILSSHFDLKALYTKELEQISQMSLIKRFSLRKELYDKVMENPQSLEDLDYFLRPLLSRDIDKIYNPNKALQYQKLSKRKEEEASEETIDFDEEEWEFEQEQIRMQKKVRYEKSLGYLLSQFVKHEAISLGEIQKNLSGEEKEELIPNVEIFREIMIELIRNREIDIAKLKEEKSEYIIERQGEFQLNEMILDLIERNEELREIKRIYTYRLNDGEIVDFQDVLTENGVRKTIHCSNVMFRVMPE